jgi:hypothetical protein
MQSRKRATQIAAGKDQQILTAEHQQLITFFSGMA